MRNTLILFFVVLLLPGCRFSEPVQFRMIDNVEIVSIKDGFVHLTAEAVFSNPNKVKGKLKDVDIAIELEGRSLATITQAKALQVKPNAEFRMPINIQFAMEDIQQGLLSNLMNILTGNKLKLHFVGRIKVGTFIFSQAVPVDYYEEVKLQL